MARLWTAWTPPKIRRLKALFPVSTMDALVVLFAPHSEGAIKMAARRAGLMKGATKRKSRDWMAICRAHRPTFALGGVVPGEVV